jgi:hypothetical protein
MRAQSAAGHGGDGKGATMAPRSAARRVREHGHDGADRLDMRWPGHKSVISRTRLGTASQEQAKQPFYRRTRATRAFGPSAPREPVL